MLVDGVYQTFSCGKCFACQSRRRQDWQFRIKQEQNDSICSYTLTLTYSDEHLPSLVPFYPPGECEEKMDVDFDTMDYVISPNPPLYYYHPLDYNDVQLFHKQLRNKGYKFRFFCVGEYGGQHGRPHYHIIYFFKYPVDYYKFEKDCLILWKRCERMTLDYTSDRSIGYTLKYCLKFYDHKNENPYPIVRCSKRPYIGAGYMTDAKLAYHYTAETDYSSQLGFKQRLPRIYRDKFFDDNLKEITSEKLESFIEKAEIDYQEKYGVYDDTHKVSHKQSVRDAFSRRCINSIKKKKL